MPDSEMLELLIRPAPIIAHRICDELSITQTATKRLIDDESVPIEVRSKIELIQSHTKHVAGIARQFLVITGNQEPPDAVLYIHDVLSQIETLIQRLLGDDIQLRMIFDSGLGPIKGNFDSLVQIFFALAANGRDAMPDGGIICIRASNLTKAECEVEPRMAPIASDYVLVEFGDTGIGIPDHVVDRIFEPFFTTKGEGCGFGLATVHATIKKMNGHIFVNSKIGRGTTFLILMPMGLQKIK